MYDFGIVQHFLRSNAQFYRLLLAAVVQTTICATATKAQFIV